MVCAVTASNAASCAALAFVHRPFRIGHALMFSTRVVQRCGFGRASHTVPLGQLAEGAGVVATALTGVVVVGAVPHSSVQVEIKYPFIDASLSSRILRYPVFEV